MSKGQEISSHVSARNIWSTAGPLHVYIEISVPHIYFETNKFDCDKISSLRFGASTLNTSSLLCI